MEKFWKVFCLIAYRIGIFLIFLITCPVWILLGIICGICALFGAYDDYSNMDVYESFDKEIAPMITDDKISDEYTL